MVDVGVVSIIYSDAANGTADDAAGFTNRWQENQANGGARQVFSYLFMNVSLYDPEICPFVSIIQVERHLPCVPFVVLV